MREGEVILDCGWYGDPQVVDVDSARWPTSEHEQLSIVPRALAERYIAAHREFNAARDAVAACPRPKTVHVRRIVVERAGEPQETLHEEATR